MSANLFSDLLLVGERVVLVPVHEDKAVEVYDVLKKPESKKIFENLLWEGPDCLEDISSYYSTWKRCSQKDFENISYSVMILLQDSENQVTENDNMKRTLAKCSWIGGAHFAMSTIPDTITLGYYLRTDMWGKGLMTEALQILVWLCFEHLGAEYIAADPFEHNIGSQRVLEKLGMKVVSNPDIYPQIPRSHTKSGKVISSIVYRLHKLNWDITAPGNIPKIAKF